MKLNTNLFQYEKENTFSRVKEKIAEYKQQHPKADVVSLGIGDVSCPIPQPAVDAIKDACENLTNMANFPGYGAYYGLSVLKEAILSNDYKDFGFTFDELYVSDGTKTDSGNILELFDKNVIVGIPSTMYPVYANSCIAMGRTTIPLGMNDKMKCLPPWGQNIDLIYLCSPNNPSGIAYTYEDLEQWLQYCKQYNAIIIYDNVYEPFIRNENCPHSIYEIEGMKSYAIELRSFSKKASFTGMRCSYYIIPNKLYPDINFYWHERTLNRFNGASYLSQIGAAATYLPESQKIITDNIKYYQKNTDMLKQGLTDLGFTIIGGEDAPFMLIKNLTKKSSWDMFHWFLKQFNIVVIPGIIFGQSCDGYCRLSALGPTTDIEKAIMRIKEYYKNEKAH